jgi:hypothetical protein
MPTLIISRRDDPLGPLLGLVRIEKASFLHNASLGLSLSLVAMLPPLNDQPFGVPLSLPQYSCPWEFIPRFRLRLSYKWLGCGGRNRQRGPTPHLDRTYLQIGQNGRSEFH